MRTVSCSTCGVEVTCGRRGPCKTYCPPCAREQANATDREWRRNNPEKSAKRYRRHRLKRDYGLTTDDAEALLAKPCAICGKDSEVIDHNHQTGAVRAALCFNCNSGIGMLGDNVDRVRKAVAYLERYAPTP